MKEVPVKEDDHGMDPTRYVAAWVDNLHVEGGGEFFASLGDLAVYAVEEEYEGRGFWDQVAVSLSAARPRGIRVWAFRSAAGSRRWTGGAGIYTSRSVREAAVA